MSSTTKSTSLEDHEAPLRASGSRLRVSSGNQAPTAPRNVVLLAGDCALQALADALAARDVEVLWWREPLSAEIARHLLGIAAIVIPSSTARSVSYEWLGDPACLPDCTSVVFWGDVTPARADLADRRHVTVLPASTDAAECAQTILNLFRHPSLQCSFGLSFSPAVAPGQGAVDSELVLGRFINELANISMTLQPALQSLEESAQKDPALVDTVGVLTRGFSRLVACTRDTALLVGELGEDSGCSALQVIEHFVDSGIAGLSPRQRFLSRVAQDLWSVELSEATLTKLCSNLFDNARHATVNGGRIRLEAENVTQGTVAATDATLIPGDYVRLRISDDGHGMPESVLRQAGSTFFSTWGQERNWSGLGLAQSSAICQRAGGALALRSSSGKGTVATAYLPRARSEHTARSPRGAATVGSGGARFLVVDDEPLILASLERDLTGLGHVVYLAQDATTAMAILEEESPCDYAIVDVHLGSDSGIALARRMQSRFPSLQVVLSTGFGAPSETESLLAPMDHAIPVLTKPFTMNALLSATAQAHQSRL